MLEVELQMELINDGFDNRGLLLVTCMSSMQKKIYMKFILWLYMKSVGCALLTIKPNVLRVLENVKNHRRGACLSP